MAGTRGCVLKHACFGTGADLRCVVSSVVPEPENKKNEWTLESNAVSDPALARLIEVVDDQSDTARWMRSHLGTFDSSDLEHLREANEVATAHENALKGAERSAFEALRAQGAWRERRCAATAAEGFGLR